MLWSRKRRSSGTMSSVSSLDYFPFLCRCYYGQKNLELLCSSRGIYTVTALSPFELRFKIGQSWWGDEEEILNQFKISSRSVKLPDPTPSPKRCCYDAPGPRTLLPLSPDLTDWIDRDADLDSGITCGDTLGTLRGAPYSYITGFGVFDTSLSTTSIAKEIIAVILFT